jgi:hypothetical protein
MFAIPQVTHRRNLRKKGPIKEEKQTHTRSQIICCGHLRMTTFSKDRIMLLWSNN